MYFLVYIFQNTCVCAFVHVPSFLYHNDMTQCTWHCIVINLQKVISQFLFSRKVIESGDLGDDDIRISKVNRTYQVYRGMSPTTSNRLEVSHSPSCSTIHCRKYIGAHSSRMHATKCHEINMRRIILEDEIKTFDARQTNKQTNLCMCRPTYRTFVEWGELHKIQSCFFKSWFQLYLI